MRWLLALTVFAATAVGVRQFAIHRWGHHNLPRNPAAVPRSLQMPDFEKSVLDSARKHLLAESEIFKTDGGVELKFGSFVARDESGQPAYPCQIYDAMALTFHAEGVAVAGERPVLVIETSCHEVQDRRDLPIAWIPVSEILENLQPGDHELTSTQTQKSTLKFVNMVEEWPHQWTLSEVKFYKKDTEDRKSLIIETRTLKQERPFTMNW